MERKNKPKYYKWKDTWTGKIKREKIDEELEEFFSENEQEGEVSNTSDVLRTLPCPYNFDSPESYKELSKPFRKAKFTCDVNVEISLTAGQETEHKHDVMIDFSGEVTPEIDLSEYELDTGGFFCGLFYYVTPQVNVTLRKKELKEDKNVKEYIEQIESRAKSNVDPQEIEANKIRLDNHQNLFSQLTNYLEMHLTEEIKRVVDRLTFEIHTLNDKGGEREESIKIILYEEEKELRKRLLTTKGRTPINQQSDFEEEREKFLEECLQSLKKLDNSRKKLNKSQLAESLFRDLNPLQSLRRKLKVVDLSFEEILEKYNEQKSS